MAKRQPQQRVSPQTPGARTSSPKVNYTRDELSNMLYTYYLIRDAIEGETAIKGLTGGAAGISGSGNGGIPIVINNVILTRAMRYLPQPNPTDKSQQNLERYRAYVTRAIFYEVTGRTLEGMAGQIFLRPPTIEIPSELDNVQDNANGAGLTLDQTAYMAVRHLIAYGRSGCLVDYPIVGEVPTTKAALANGDIQPTITIYNPWDIINWRIERQGAKMVLTMVVLRETFEEDSGDGFQFTQSEQFRVLSIENGKHVVEMYDGKEGNFISRGKLMPVNAKGNPFTEIPFHFMGSENNDVSVDRPPLYGLATLNIGHYRNSADYEEACFICGQPTPVLSGLSEDWVKNILNGEVVLGSRNAIPLPVNARAELLQAKPNSMPYEAMKLKEEQMVSLGAKLVQLQRSARSATQQIIETTSESSTLANISKNVSDVMEWALEMAAAFVGADAGSIEYQLNRDFDLTSMTADDQNAVIKQWQSAAIDFSEMRTVLRKAGTASLPDDEARKAIQKDIDDGLIPDPTLEQNPPPLPPATGAGGNPPKAPSTAGGPQPKRIRRQSKP
jgi:hypothetical protein